MPSVSAMKISQVLKSQDKHNASIKQKNIGQTVAYPNAKLRNYFDILTI